MFALDVDGAKRIAIVLFVAFIVLAAVSAWFIKNVTTKIIMVLVLVGLALGVWTQRTSLQDCATRVKQKAAVGDFSSTTCTFFGTDVNVPEVRVLG